MSFFFVKGIFFVIYLVLFVVVKVFKWGFYLNFQGVDIFNDFYNIYILGKFVGFFSICIYWECFFGEDKVLVVYVNLKNL